MKKILLLLIALFWFDSALAIDVVAKVNNEVVSTLDLKKRIKIISVTSNIPKSESEKMADHLKFVATQELIDECLFRQEAERLNINLTNEEVQSAISYYEMSMGLDGRTLEQFASQKGLDYKVLMKYISSRLLWDKIVSLAVAPSVSVSTDELENIRQQEKNQEDIQYVTLEQVAIIPVTDKANENANVINEIKSGKDIEKLKREYPGVLFTNKKVVLSMDNISTELRKEIHGAKTGDFLNLLPIKMNNPEQKNAFLLVKLVDLTKVKRSFANSKAKLKQIYIKNSDKEELDLQFKRLKALKKNNATCSNLDKIASKMGLPKSYETEIFIRDLDPPLQKVLENTPILQVTDVVKNDRNELRVMAICSLTQDSSISPSDTEVKKDLYANKVKHQSQLLLDQIRSAALIQIIEDK